jgi:hypothetical protein
MHDGGREKTNGVSDPFSRPWLLPGSENCEDQTHLAALKMKNRNRAALGFFGVGEKTSRVRTGNLLTTFSVLPPQSSP